MRNFITWHRVGVLLILVFAAPGLQAQLKSAEFSTIADATIYQEFPDGNGGAHSRFCIGNEVASKLRRGYIRYDLSEIPRGSTITRVVLNMHQYRVRFQGPGAPHDETLVLHRVTSDWEEGTGTAANTNFNTYLDDECGRPTDMEGVVTWNNAPSNKAEQSLNFFMPAELNWEVIIDTDEGRDYDGLIDDVQHWVNGGGSYGWLASVDREGKPDNARLMTPDVLYVEWDESTATAFEMEINPGLNDAWYSKATDGQGMFIIVYPDIQLIFLAWFTYEADSGEGALAALQNARTPAELTAMLGDDDHRWLTASGIYNQGDTSVELDVTITRGGKFDAGDPVERETDGTITLNFEDCDSIVANYDIPSIGRSDSVELERVAKDNVALCEAMLD